MAAENGSPAQISISAQRVIEQIKALMGCAQKAPLWTNFIDPKTVELLVNDDGSLWVEKLGSPLTRIGSVAIPTVYSIIRNVSGFHDQIVDASHPVCEGEFPVDGSRFEGLIPPVVRSPSFSIRKKASAIFTLENYVASGIMTQKQEQFIEQAITGKKNILIVGGTGSGKTTLINGIIEKMVHLCPEDRIIIIEDTGEIQCTAKDKLQLRATKQTTMTDLLRATLRLRPDRILVGEVRGPEALDLMDAWNTGHPGGMATVHANSAVEGLIRLKSLTMRNPFCPREGIEDQVAEAVNVVINIARFNHSRTIREICAVQGFKNGGFVTSRIA